MELIFIRLLYTEGRDNNTALNYIVNGLNS